MTVSPNSLSDDLTCVLERYLDVRFVAVGCKCAADKLPLDGSKATQQQPHHVGSVRVRKFSAVLDGWKSWVLRSNALAEIRAPTYSTCRLRVTRFGDPTIALHIPS